MFRYHLQHSEILRFQVVTLHLVAPPAATALGTKCVQCTYAGQNRDFEEHRASRKAQLQKNGSWQLYDCN